MTKRFEESLRKGLDKETKWAVERFETKVSNLTKRLVKDNRLPTTEEMAKTIGMIDIWGFLKLLDEHTTYKEFVRKELNRARYLIMERIEQEILRIGFLKDGEKVKDVKGKLMALEKIYKLYKDVYREEDDKEAIPLFDEGDLNEEKDQSGDIQEKQDNGGKTTKGDNDTQEQKEI